MMKDAWLLCFDEFQVTHISDAIIMKRLFSVLFEKGAIVVATSNRPPEDLYLNGLNRPLFLPFIPMLKQFCKVHDIASSHDYRLATAGEDDDRRLYIFPNGKDEQKLLERKFYRLCQGEVMTGLKVQTQGRTIVVPKSAVNTGVAWFRFKDLCDRPLGAGDYLAICAEYHTVFVADIPKLTLQERDQVRRFITLIDTFYERHTRLICTADREPYTLFEVAEAEKENTTMDEIFAWDRTVSRLIEMQSVKYQTQIARSIPGEQFLGQFDLKAIGDDECEDLWRRYDADENGILSLSEVKFMFEDLVEVNKGHRSLKNVNVEDCLKIMDSDRNGVVDFQDFQMFVQDYSKVSSTLKL
jgi:predicted ATPase